MLAFRHFGRAQRDAAALDMPSSLTPRLLGGFTDSLTDGFGVNRSSCRHYAAAFMTSRWPIRAAPNIDAG